MSAAVPESADAVWHGALRSAVQYGDLRRDRTGVGTYATFGEQLVFDNRECVALGLDVFPAVTTKRLAYSQVAAELSCFLNGCESLEEFHDRGCTIWDGNGGAEYWRPRARYAGDLGRIYGVQWRRWRSPSPALMLPRDVPGVRASVNVVDQLERLLDGMRRDPYGRRHLVTAWNPGELDVMCLPPCHVLWQCWVRDDGDGGTGQTVDLRVDMRSVDLFLGLPFDVASYATVQRLVARELGMSSGFLTFHLGDAHVYLNHLEAVQEVLSRGPFPSPGLALADDATLTGFRPSQARMTDYASHPAVPAPLNV